MQNLESSARRETLVTAESLKLEGMMKGLVAAMATIILGLIAVLWTVLNGQISQLRSDFRDQLVELKADVRVIQGEVRSGSKGLDTLTDRLTVLIATLNDQERKKQQGGPQ